MRPNKFLNAFLIILTPLMLLVSCGPEWEEHYYAEITEKSELNIVDFIKTKPELSTFSEMLELTGYDEILAENQTYTVWAPTNASLAEIDLNNSDLVYKTVRNHITRFTLPSSGVKSRLIEMMNGKFLYFSRTSGELRFGDKKVIQPDLAVSNGIVHVIENYVPYILNIWEYIAVAPGIDSLRNYVNSLTTLEFDEDKSYLDGVLIDSIFTETNQILTNLGYFNREDTSFVYTALLPHNAAWKQAYDMIMPYYNCLEADGGSSAQIKNTRWTIARDLFFRKKLQSPVAVDTLTTTYGTKLTNPLEIIPATTPTVMSNGYSYITSDYKHKPIDAWHRTIRIEAETAAFGRTSNFYELTTFTGIGSGYNISGGYYLNARSISSLGTSRLMVNFPLPNTLAAKYNVYCVVVPLSITDTANQRKYKLKFSLNFDYDQGPKRDSVWVTSTGPKTGAHTTAKIFETNPKAIDKILVLENYSFPFANIVQTGNRISDMETGNRIRVGLRVESATGVTASDRQNYSRDIRLDCILLEPVE